MGIQADIISSGLNLVHIGWGTGGVGMEEKSTLIVLGPRLLPKSLKIFRAVCKKYSAVCLKKHERYITLRRARAHCELRRNRTCMRSTCGPTPCRNTVTLRLSMHLRQSYRLGNMPWYLMALHFLLHYFSWDRAERTQLNM